ncbi:MAG TPA: hypothetical protein VK447_20185 [Myxococcaceae bacterium]|nr:hypothetical protein [Myxococcaceae bacterium]
MSLPFHLCQPGGGASCGACCGLYNFKDHSRANLTRALERRTEAVRALPKTPEAFRAAAESLRARDEGPLFPMVRVCPMLGFLDAEQARVGCLAHPKVTGGPDLRDCGVYNANVCETFECPSFLWLDPAQARLIRAACADWYLYGLVVTDVEFVRGCLRLLADERGGAVDPEALLARPEALAAVRALFSLKETAPGRGEHGAVFGRFDPNGEGDGALRTLPYGRLGLSSAPEDDVVLCLGYAPGSAGELLAARALVREHVRGVAVALG